MEEKHKACHKYHNFAEKGLRCKYIRGFDMTLVVTAALDSLAWHCSSSSPVVIPAPT